MKPITPEIKKVLLAAQKDEVTEAIIYHKLTALVKNEHNAQILKRIGQQEVQHARIWQSYTGEKVKPSHFKVWFYVMVVRLFGLTFGIKLMEQGEKNGIVAYDKIADTVADAREIQREEEEHEYALIDMLKDRPLDYLGSVVLGLNDALVELTGVLAGLTFGLQNAKMIASVGIITGIAAAFSMAGSEYLSTKTDNDGNVKPLTASVYTGIAYIITVVALVLPYLLMSNVYWGLAITIVVAIAIIAIFNYYTSVSKGYSFKTRFMEMVIISLSVAFISFIIGLLVKSIFHIEM